MALTVAPSSGETGWLGLDPLCGGFAGLSLSIAASLFLAHLVFYWKASDQGEWVAAAFGGLAGLVFFLAVLDPGWVDLRNSQWLEQGPPGWQTAQGAWVEFHSNVGEDAPLFNREGQERVGSLILANGAIPLLALPAKALSATSSQPFQYLGAWLLACYGLQGIYGGLLMRCLTQDPRLQMIGTGFLVLSPILLNRVAYPATAAHGLLLAGLWLYFRTWGTNWQGWLWIGWCLLMVLMRPLDPKGIQPWTPLLVLAGVLTLLSLPPQLAVGSFVLLDLNGKVPDWLLVWMGATGRCFRLVSYAFLFLLIALLVHPHPARRALVLLAFALALQAADLHGVHVSATSQPPLASEARGPAEPPEPLPVALPLRIPWSR